MPAGSAITQTLATTAVDSYLSGGTDSFFMGGTTKYSSFTLDTENVETKPLTTTEVYFDVPRHGDGVTGIAFLIRGPGIVNASAANEFVIPGKPIVGEAGVLREEISHQSPDLCARFCDFAGAQAIVKTRWVVSGVEVDRITGTHIQLFYSLFADIVPRRCLNVGTKAERARYALRSEIEWYVPVPFYFSSGCYARAWNLLATNFSSLRLYVECRSPLACIENGAGVTWMADGLGNNDLPCALRTYDAAAAPVLSDYQISLLVTYVYFSKAERKARLNETVDQLIVQHQEAQAVATLTSGSQANNKELPFNFPVAHLCVCPRWSVRQDANELGCFMGPADANRTSADFQEDGDHLIADMAIKFNNKVRQEAMRGLFYTEFQPSVHAKRVPEHNHIYLYSFGLESCYEQQPTGSANFSRIDTVKLDMTAGQFAGSAQVDTYVSSFNVGFFDKGTLTLRFAS